MRWWERGSGWVALESEPGLCWTGCTVAASIQALSRSGKGLPKSVILSRARSGYGVCETSPAVFVSDLGL